MADEPGPGFFRVHLESLTALAHELDSQIDALARPMEYLAHLASQPLALGAFGEADELSRQHLATAAAMDGLLRSGRDAVGFAAEVTRAIVTGYAEHDRTVADSYRIGPGGAMP